MIAPLCPYCGKALERRQAPWSAAKGVCDPCGLDVLWATAEARPFRWEEYDEPTCIASDRVWTDPIRKRRLVGKSEEVPRG